jgi:hypothetical protein
MSFEDLTAVLINPEAFWDIKPCQLINIYCVLKDLDFLTLLLHCLTQYIKAVPFFEK